MLASITRPTYTTYRYRKHASLHYSLPCYSLPYVYLTLVSCGVLNHCGLVRNQASLVGACSTSK